MSEVEKIDASIAALRGYLSAELVTAFDSKKHFEPNRDWAPIREHCQQIRMNDHVLTPLQRDNLARAIGTLERNLNSIVEMLRDYSKEHGGGAYEKGFRSRLEKALEKTISEFDAAAIRHQELKKSEEANSSQSLVERYLNALKSNRVIAILIVAGLVLGAIVQFSESILKLPFVEDMLPVTPVKDGGRTLRIERVELFPESDTAEIRVSAFVNGTEFRYPSVASVEWLKVAPSMSGQTFKLPKAETYELRFEMRKRERGISEEGSLVSLETVSLKAVPFSGTYKLHGFDPSSKSRSGTVDAEITFTFQAIE